MSSKNQNEKRKAKNMSMLRSLDEESSSREAGMALNGKRSLEVEPEERSLSREKLKINKLNNGFVSQKELVTSSP